MESNLPSSSNLILGILGEFIRRLLGGGRNKSGESDIGFLIIFLALAILFVIATAPFKILLRKNFGQNALSFIEVIAGTLFFGLFSFIAAGLAIYSSTQTYKSIYEAYFMDKYILAIIAVIFFFVAMYVLVKGLKENSRHSFSIRSSWERDNYRGDSLLFEDHVKNDLERKMKVWRNIEPAFCFKWSLILLIIHPLLGFPFLFSSISFWVNENFHVRFRWEKQFFAYQQSENNNYSNTQESYVS